MSYLVLARKWRPRSFDDLAGQEPITRILKNAVSQGKTSHAYLFSGPRGVGKTSTARILAKALNCIEGPTPAPCGVCDSCVAITEGSSVDVFEIDGASNNSVEDIRDLRERVKYAPSGGKNKVYIIDEVHMLSGSAFNALLKTLEEPPPHVIFVLATTEMKKIPATVLSRCQHMPFRRISTSVIKARLAHIAETEQISISAQALGLVAKAADGSMRDSLTILDQLSSFTDEITAEQVQNLLCITDFGMLARSAEAVITGDRAGLLEIIEGLADTGADFRVFTRELAQFFRDLLIASVMQKPTDALDLNPEEETAVSALTARATEDQLTLMLAEIMKAETDVRNSSLPRMALEMALIRVSFLSSLKPVKEVIANLDRYYRDLPAADSGPVRTPEVSSPAGADKQPHKTAAVSRRKKEEPRTEPLPPEISAQEEPVGDARPDSSAMSGDLDIQSVWQQVLASIDPPLASKLAHARIELKDGRLHILLNGGHAAVFQDTITKNLPAIEQKLTEYAGRTLAIEVEIRQKKTVRKKELKEQALTEPVIKEALELFEGRIVDVIPIDDDASPTNGGENV